MSPGLWRSSAPSNIALIKYMGKSSPTENRPSNASLSYSLEHLRTAVQIERVDQEGDSWAPLVDPEYPEKVTLSEQGQQRFVSHFAFLKKHWGLEGNYLLKSANNFPADCGLASSASSFAALTLAGAELARDQKPEFHDQLERSSLSILSRQGSGSSCRSLFGPWSLWRDEGAEEVEFPQGDLLHQAIIVEAGKKLVSSSEAHLRVTSSALFQGRRDRAETRLRELVTALKQGDWQRGFDLCWAEFWDMHALFETSEPSFGYMKPESLQVLDLVRHYWQSNGDGPWATMDAGANVHLLYRQDQLKDFQELQAQLEPMGRIIAHGG